MAEDRLNITRHDLQDLLEDRLDVSRKRAVVAALEKDPRLRGELESWRKMRADLHAIFDPVLDEPLSPSLRHQVRQLNRAIRTKAASGEAGQARKRNS